MSDTPVPASGPIDAVAEIRAAEDDYPYFVMLAGLSIPAAETAQQALDEINRLRLRTAEDRAVIAAAIEETAAEDALIQVTADYPRLSNSHPGVARLNASRDARVRAVRGVGGPGDREASEPSVPADGVSAVEPGFANPPTPPITTPTAGGTTPADPLPAPDASMCGCPSHRSGGTCWRFPADPEAQP